MNVAIKQNNCISPPLVLKTVKRRFISDLISSLFVVNYGNFCNKICFGGEEMDAQA